MIVFSARNIIFSIPIRQNFLENTFSGFPDKNIRQRPIKGGKFNFRIPAGNDACLWR